MIALALAILIQESPEKHVDLELSKIEALSPRFQAPNKPELEDVKACKNVMRGLGEWCGKDADRIRAVSRALGKLLARKGITKTHEYYYIWLGHPFLREQPPEDVAWLDGLVERIDAYRKIATPEPAGREQLDADIAIMCGEILGHHTGTGLNSRDLNIDWKSWDASKAVYAKNRPTLRYDPAAKKYAW